MGIKTVAKSLALLALCLLLGAPCLAAETDTKKSDAAGATAPVGPVAEFWKL